MVVYDLIEINKIYLGDNLKIIRKCPNNSINLIYLDPPFFTQSKRKLKQYSYDDKWDSLKDYLMFMNLRLKELYRVLNSTGSFYLHCNYRASHYLKMLCDKIFGYNNFRNEIVWHYRSWTTSNKIFQKMHDNILFYTKSKDYTFNIPYEPYITKGRSKYLKMSKKGGGIKPNKSKLRKDYFGDEIKMHDVWDIPIIVSNEKERLGYPTQKPEKLLNIIVNASSNEGDIILDSFCGSGTTCVSAAKLNRKFIGIDSNPDAVKLTKERLKMPVIYNKIKNDVMGLF
ncbi:hypothetical protein LCGC14_0664810 [marine sediment metagenome]|uniref:DNA methylase N-4/N-6 domain-containing protein n=1 Tax=marine sediment metagenome TaxID=412755 RepID=A0A0F9QSP0_9ZZZZ